MDRTVRSGLWRRRLLVVLGGVALLASAAAARAQEIFDIEDYFILAPDSAWHYTGEGQPGSSPDDDFTWSVEALPKDIDGLVTATVILTTTDEPDDDRSMDRDYWQLDANGDLLYWGFYNGVADTGFPVQDIVLDDPLRIGGRGIQIGEVLSDSATGTVMAGLPPFIPIQNVSGSVDVTITYVEFLPFLDTPIGRFYHVLHMILDFTGTATLPPPIGQQSFPVKAAEVYLVEGVGMILQDQNADANDAEIQIIDQAQVAGQTITRSQNAARDWTLYR